MSEQQSLQVTETGIVVPMMSVERAVDRYRDMAHFAGEVLKEGIDYGTIPGVNKPALFKAGAEKITTFFGLSVEMEIIHKVEDWTGVDHGGEPLFHYTARGYLSKNGQVIATADGSCNSWESKYRWRWVPEHELPEGVNKAALKRRGGAISEFGFAVDKAETGGKYGKPAEYWQKFKDAIENGTAREIQKETRSGQSYKAWEIADTQYRIPSDDVYSLVNTILKMAEKRAFVAVTLLGTSASEFYTQDVEDFAQSVTPVAPAVNLDVERAAVKSLWVNLAGNLELVSLPIDAEGGNLLKSILGELYDGLATAQAGFVQLADSGVRAIVTFRANPVIEQDADDTQEQEPVSDGLHDEDIPPEAR